MTMVTEVGAEFLPPASKDRAKVISTALRKAARDSRTPVVAITGGGGFRARKSDRIYWFCLVFSFLVVFFAPAVTASVYYGLLASDQYASEARLILRTGEGSVFDQLSGFTNMFTSQQAQDNQILVNYVGSRAMVEKIDRQLDLRGIYSRPEADWWARFNASKPIEDLEKYWRKRVDVALEQSSSIIYLEARAFKPEDALQIIEKVVENAEELVNGIAERARADAVRDSKDTLERAEKRLRAATDAMREERNRLGILNGDSTAKGIEMIINGLRLMLAQRQQERAVLAKTLRPDAPAMRQLDTIIGNLTSSINNYLSQMADAQGTSGQATLADRMESLSLRQAEIDVAQKLYANAVVSYEGARLDAETKHGYLTPFQRPTLAQKPLYPQRLFSWTLIVVPAFLIWALLAGLAYLVRNNLAS
jgi:capsular polysaccharide transport system permease protein